MDIKILEIFLEAATPGPWNNFIDTKTIQVSSLSPAAKRGHFNLFKYPSKLDPSLLSNLEWIANAELCTDMRTSLPILIKFIKELEQLCLDPLDINPSINKNDILKKILITFEKLAERKPTDLNQIYGLSKKDKEFLLYG